MNKIKKPNKTNKQKYQTKLIKTEQNKASKRKQSNNKKRKKNEKRYVKNKKLDN